jgi:hypothetical protein
MLQQTPSAQNPLVHSTASVQPAPFALSDEPLDAPTDVLEVEPVAALELLDVVLLAAFDAVPPGPAAPIELDVVALPVPPEPNADVPLPHADAVRALAVAVTATLVTATSQGERRSPMAKSRPSWCWLMDSNVRDRPLASEPNAKTTHMLRSLPVPRPAGDYQDIRRLGSEGLGAPTQEHLQFNLMKPRRVHANVLLTMVDGELEDGAGTWNLRVASRIDTDDAPHCFPTLVRA